MFEGRKPHLYPHNYIGDISHREIARQAVRESIVLLKIITIHYLLNQANIF